MFLVSPFLVIEWDTWWASVTLEAHLLWEIFQIFFFKSVSSLLNFFVFTSWNSCYSDVGFPDSLGFFVLTLLCSFWLYYCLIFCISSSSSSNPSVSVLMCLLYKNFIFWVFEHSILMESCSYFACEWSYLFLFLGGYLSNSFTEIQLTQSIIHI